MRAEDGGRVGGFGGRDDGRKGGIEEGGGGKLIKGRRGTAG